MANALEYVIRLRDELSGKLGQVAYDTGNALGNIAGGALLVSANFRDIANAAKTGFDALTGDYDGLVGMISSLPGPIGQVGGVVAEFVAGAIDNVAGLAEEYRKLSEATGVSVTFISRFTEASDDLAISSDTVNAALSIFSRKLGGVEDAMDGSGISADKFSRTLREMGIDSDNVEDALMKVADKFAAMPNGTDKAALAVQLFGKRGAELIPILNQGSAGIKAMGDEAEKLGLVLTDADASAVRRLKASQDQLNDSFEALARRVGVSVIPRIAEATEAFNNFDKRTRVMYQYIDARNVEGGTLAEKLFGRVATWQMYTEVAGQFVETLSVSSQALNEFGEWNMTAADRLSIASDKTYTAADAYEQMYGNLNHVKDNIPSFASALDQTIEPTESMKRATLGVRDALGDLPQKMDAAQKAALLYKLASGEMSFEQFEAATATRAINQAMIDGKLTLEEGAGLMKGLTDKTVPAAEAMKRAGDAGKDASKFIDEMNKSLSHVKDRNINIAFTGFKTPAFTDGAGTYDRLQNKTVTVGISSGNSVSELSDMQGYIDAITGKVVDVGVRTYGKSTVAPGSEASLDDFTNYIYTYVNGKMVQVGASVTGKRSVVNGSEDSLEGFVNYVYTYVNGKMVQVGANVTGRGDLQNVVDNVNYLKNTHGTVAVTAQVTYYNGDSSGAGAYLAQPAARGTRSTPSGNVAINAPFSVTTTDVAAARALKRDIENTARRAQLRAAMGGL